MGIEDSLIVCFNKDTDDPEVKAGGGGEADVALLFVNYFPLYNTTGIE